MIPTADVLTVEWTWKSPAMRRMTVAVCRLALRMGHGGTFSALDLPAHGAEEHGGSGIAGSVFGLLADAGIIAPVGDFMGGEFQQKTVKNRCGNRIGVWRLAPGGTGRAEALLKAHGEEPAKFRQSEFFGAVGS